MAADYLSEVNFVGITEFFKKSFYTVLLLYYP